MYTSLCIWSPLLSPGWIGQKDIRRGQNFLRKLIKHVCSTVGKQRVKTFSHTPLPHTMFLLAGTFRSTLNGGGGGLEFYTNNQFARSSPVFNNFLNTFVPDCRYQSCSILHPGSAMHRGTPACYCDFGENADVWSLFCLVSRIHDLES